MACKKAIKAGDALSGEAVSHLLREMLSTGIMPTCPHGRPIVVEITKRDLEKRFKRIV
jgi:DNA mismatch repair protein MutL